MDNGQLCLVKLRVGVLTVIDELFKKKKSNELILELQIEFAENAMTGHDEKQLLDRKKRNNECLS